MFDRIAGKYDSLNHLLSLDLDRHWRKRAIRRLLEGHGGEKLTILDLACGTGDLSIALAERLRRQDCRGSRVVGVDLSEGMLAVMREKVRRAGLEACISLSVGDGEALNFGSGIFDAVTIAFGIRNFEDREGGLKEMRRVLKPGGKLAVLELSLPENRLIRWGCELYFKYFLPAVGGSVSGTRPAYEYLPASVRAFPGKREFTTLLSRCGFSQVRHEAMTFGLCRLYTGVKED